MNYSHDHQSGTNNSYIKIIINSSQFDICIYKKKKHFVSANVHLKIRLKNDEKQCFISDTLK